MFNLTCSNINQNPTIYSNKISIYTWFCNNSKYFILKPKLSSRNSLMYCLWVFLYSINQFNKVIVFLNRMRRVEIQIICNNSSQSKSTTMYSYVVVLNIRGPPVTSYTLHLYLNFLPFQNSLTYCL